MSNNNESIDYPQVYVHLDSEAYTSKIMVGKHSLIADEPTSVGGKDLGPGPYELLLASLGSCTAMTIKMYAKRKEWDLKEVKVGLSHSKDYSRDCETCESSSSKIDIIERNIELIGNLDKKQRDRLLDIANKCPVHKTLLNDVNIETSLVKS
ncbi:MAG: putative OsmC-like protein [Cyclobacteriaceae bacterium]|jgi:putative redox protein